MENFQLISEYQPTGDQPAAIHKLVEGLRSGMHEQTLLGVTGSGKTFTMANVIAQINKPTLILAHNKTLAEMCIRDSVYTPRSEQQRHWLNTISVNHYFLNLWFN